MKKEISSRKKRLRVLFNPMTSSSIAHTVRCLAVANEMRKRNYDVYFTSCQFRKKFIEGYGYEVVKTYNPVNINDPEDQSVNYLKDNKEKFIEWFRSEIEAARTLRPDVVVAAPAIFGPHVYYATNIPVVSIMDVQYLGDHSKGLMGLSRSTNKISDHLLTAILRPFFDYQFIRAYLSEIMDIYSSLGLKSDFKKRIEFYKPLTVLIPGDEQTQPMRKYRENTFYIGPLFWKEFESMKTDINEEKIIRFKGKNKLIYLTFGGSVFDKTIYDSIINSLEKTNYKFIISLGPNFDRNLFRNDNDNLIIRNFVPGLKVSNYAEVVINTGAQGSVMQGLWYGKPQISFPTIMDQAYFANRLQEMGLGINANPVSILGFSKRESYARISNNIPGRILKAIDNILKNKKYFSRALKFSKYLHQYKDSEVIATNLIEKSIKC